MISPTKAATGCWGEKPRQFAMKAETTKPTLAQLARELTAAMPPLLGEEGRLALALYRRLARAEPVSIAELAADVELDEGMVEAVGESWNGVYHDDRGRIVGFWGLSIPLMPHRIMVEGRTLHTWCAWDALFIPQLIDARVEVESIPPSGGEPVRVRVSPRAIEEVSPPHTVVSMLSPASGFDDDVIRSFCHYVHFFPTAENAASWMADRPNTFLLSVDEAFELGQLTNRARFGSALDTL